MTETVAIVDYGSGNLRSAAKAFERAAHEAGSGAVVQVTADAEAVRAADRVVLPGVGAFAECKRGLESVPGMVEALTEAVRARGQPFFGICVGMQLMASRGREHGVHAGFDWIAGEVRALAPASSDLKIPHMGWNELAIRRPHPVFADTAVGTHVYFVHSYALVCDDGRDVVAESDHGGRFVAAVARDNMVGTQFHPEKSQAAGLALIARFLAWRP